MNLHEAFARYNLRPTAIARTVPYDTQDLGYIMLADDLPRAAVHMAYCSESHLLALLPTNHKGI